MRSITGKVVMGMMNLEEGGQEEGRKQRIERGKLDRLMEAPSGRCGMKIVQKIVFGALLAVVATGCASSKGYFIDRGRDAADVVTATVGMGIGAKVRLGPFQTGVLGQIDIAGLRGGTFFRASEDCSGGFIMGNPFDLEMIAVGAENFSLKDSVRRKDFGDSSIDGLDFGTVSIWPFIHRTRNNRPSFYTQIEVVAALIPSVRLGFNPGELIDLLLGFATIDIYGDDLEATKRRKASTRY